MSTNIPTDTFPVPVLTPVQERQLCVAFFGLSLYKNGRDGDELNTRKETVKRVKTAPVSRSRVPHSSILQRRTPLRRIPVASFKRSALAVDNKMDVDSPSRGSLKRSAPDDDDRTNAEPPFKRAKTSFFLADCPLINNGPVATVTFTELVVVVNAYDGLSDGQKAGLDRWNARCNDGHLSQHAPAAVRAPVTVKITELVYKPYEELDAKAKRAWDAWNARCEAEGRSCFARSDKALGKRRALVDMTNAGSSRGGRQPQTKNKGRRENAPYALSSRASHLLVLDSFAGYACSIRCICLGPTVLTVAAMWIPLGVTTPVDAWAGVVLLLARGSCLIRVACLGNPTVLTGAATGYSWA
ncbi:hypothetical protein C8R46DRAFT_1225985 [Mycena filopes]|nr:hypothetical protein C8R46DRAFT_1225985 [Mycena filopes]